MQGHHPLGDAARLGPFVGAAGERDLACAVGRVRDELLVGVGPLPRRHGLDDRVGRREDPRAPTGSSCRAGAAPTGEPSAQGNCVGELEQVVEGRAAPRVDVLVGVADRGDRMPVAEQRVASARPARRSCPGTRRGARPGTARGGPRRPRGGVPSIVDRPLDLVAEVDHAELALQLAVAPGRSRELEPFLRGLVDALGPGGLQRVEAALERRWRRRPGSTRWFCICSSSSRIFDTSDGCHVAAACSNVIRSSTRAQSSCAGPAAAPVRRARSPRASRSARAGRAANPW